jgi:hypothetical protein
LQDPGRHDVWYTLICTDDYVVETGKIYDGRPEHRFKVHELMTAAGIEPVCGTDLAISHGNTARLLRNSMPTQVLP